MKRKLDRTLNLGQILSQPLTNEGWVPLINNMAIRMFMDLCGPKRFTFHELGWLSADGHQSLGSAHTKIEAEDGLSWKTRGLFHYKRSEDFEKILSYEVGAQEFKPVWGFTTQFEWILCWVTFEKVIHPEIPCPPYIEIVKVKICRVSLEDLLFHFNPREIWSAFGVLAENFAGNHRECYRIAQGAYDDWSRLHQLIDDLWTIQKSED